MGILPLVYVALLLNQALSVTQDQTPIRSGCATDTTVLAQLPAKTELTLRYVMAGDASPCYKVIAKLNGRSFEGYVPVDRLDGLDELNQGRKQAGSIGQSDVMRAARELPLAAITSASLVGFKSTSASRVVMAQAEEAIEMQQPAKALAILEPELIKHRDPGLYALAGMAAWRADQATAALEYWKASLAIAPNTQLEELYKKVEREKSNDQSGEKLFGIRVLLRFDPVTVPKETARQMLTVVDRSYERVSQQLGCRTDERIVTIIQSRDAYKKGTAMAEWSGGMYDGRIHIPATNGQQMNSEAERVLAHETTHACLALTGNWPAWMHEGLAQKLSGDTLPPDVRARIQQMAKAGKLPKLEKLEGNWSRLDADHATLAYSLALAAAEEMFTHFGVDGIRNLVRNPERLDAVSAELDRILGL